MDKYYIKLSSEIGTLTLIENSDGIISGIYLEDVDTNNLTNKETPMLKKLKDELNEYFKGNRKEFTVPFTQPLTPFQEEVYNVLKDVGFGYSLTYGDVAYLLGKDGGARAVGNALGRNNILILMPCHRVLGQGHLGGFSSGLDAKRKLLKLEGIKFDEKK